MHDRYAYSFLTLPTHTTAEFRQSPTSINATLGSEARFPCQANRACIVGWNVNGAPLRSPAIEDHVTAVAGAEEYHVLTVPATHEFNNSYIQCVLIDYDNALRNAVSPIATLMLQGGIFRALCKYMYALIT